jgi:hypothetical protein
MTDSRLILEMLDGSSGDLSKSLAILGQVVRDLMMEVEALRAALKELSDRAEPVAFDGDIHADISQDISTPSTVYAVAYAQTALLTHCASGLSGGWEKLIDEFYSPSVDTREWRECHMLKRLGFTEEQIARYQEKAIECEQYT